MIKKKLATILMLVGFAMVYVIFFYDGIAEALIGKEPTGFGIYQISGVVVGIIFVTIGWFRKRKETRS